MRQRKSLPSFVSFALGAVAALMIAGPATLQFTSDHDDVALEQPAEPTPEPTPEPTTEPTPEPTPEPTELTTEEHGDGETTGSGEDNHGKVVSTAAHCPVKGRAHGMLVSSIARDKDATVADAEAACEAAMAAAESDGSAKVKNEKAKGDDDDDAVEESEDGDDGEASVDSVSGGDSTKAGGPPPWAGGHGQDK